MERIYAFVSANKFQQCKPAFMLPDVPRVTIKSVSSPSVGSAMIRAQTSIVPPDSGTESMGSDIAITTPGTEHRKITNCNVEINHSTVRT